MKKKLATVMAATMAVSSSVVAVSADTTEEKIVGSNRIDTAVKISKDGWKSAETVVLVNDGAIADALTATPLSYAKNAPILLTSKKGLNAETKSEIKRLGAKNVILIGGEAVLPANIEKDLKELNANVDRVKGSTREETALEIAKRLDKISDISEIAVVNGTTGLADAVSVAAAAAERNIPIILANPKKGLTISEKFIKDEGIVKSYIIGGTVALPEKLVKNVPSKQRIEGSNRNDTNAKVIETFYKGKELKNIYVAKDGRGGDSQLIDALAVGVLAAKNGAPVLIASKKLNANQINVINTKNVDTITQVGGNGNEGAFNQLKDIEETDVYEVGTVEELKEALEKANANDKIVLKPDSTITEDIIISTDKNVDIKVEGTVTGKVDIDAPNGNVTDNSTSDSNGGGSTGGGTTTPSVDQDKVKLVNAAKAAKDFEYKEGNIPEGQKPYTYTGKITVSGNESATVNFEGAYKSINLGLGDEKKAAMNDMARYLGALHRNDSGASINAIKYNGATYTWDTKGTLKGSNWKNGEQTLVNKIVEDFRNNAINQEGQPINLVLVDKNGKEANLNINFKSTLPAKVNSVYYDTLVEAVETVVNSENKTGTVTLTKDSFGGGIKIPSGSNVTIDLGNNIYTLNDPAVGSMGTETNGFQLLQDSKVSIINGEIRVSEKSKETKIMIQNYSNLTLRNLKLFGGVPTSHIVSSNNDTVTIENVDMSGRENNLVAIDVMHWHNSYKAEPTVIVNNTEKNIIKGKITNSNCGDSDEYFDNCKDTSKIIINGGIFEGENGVVFYYPNSGKNHDINKVTINGGVFNDSTK